MIMKKAIFLDIDGTILDCLGGIPDITPNVKKRIRSLQSDGNYVFVATGRPYAFLSQAILDFGFDGFILTNGAHIIINGNTFYKDPIDKNFIKEATIEFEKRNIQYILEGELYSYMRDNCKEFYEFYDSIGISRKFLESNFNIDDVDTYKIEMLCHDKSSVDFCLSLIENNPHYDHFHSIDEKSFELYSKKNTKATAILKVLDHLNIPIENSYAFGDGKNDIEMLSTVGCGIAMGNADDDVKKYAKEITDTVHNDGVAFGIEKYILS